MKILITILLFIPLISFGQMVHEGEKENANIIIAVSDTAKTYIYTYTYNFNGVAPKVIVVATDGNVDVQNITATSCLIVASNKLGRNIKIALIKQ